jgi:ribonuclease J
MYRVSKTLEVVPLGGLGEFGMHMMAFVADDTIIVVDCGILFPEQELLGVDIIVPDVTFLIENAEKVRAIILTHGHEDHIGALPFVLPEINVPVYGSPFTLALVERKLDDHGLDDVELNEILPGDTIELGPFTVETIAVTHSIIDSLALAIRTPAGLVIHTGDFKIDYSPIDGVHFDLARFAAYGQEGVLALFSDSTNAERSGYTPSERAVEDRFDQIFRTATGRIAVACFTSSIPRIQIVAEAARRHGRKLAFLGRRMMANTEAAQQLGSLDLPKGLVIRPKDIRNYPRHEVAVIVSGCQGEPMSAMARASVDQHKDLTLEGGDTVVLSSRMIPGNERAISRMMDHLYRRHVNVIYQDGTTPPVHVSGHASAEELKLMMMLTRPKFFIPIHGSYGHLHRHAQLAEKTGVIRDQILIAETGDVIRIEPDSIAITGKAPVGRVLIDQGSLEEVADIVVRDRRHISEDGIVLPVIVINKQTGEVETSPEIVFRGMTVGDDDPFIDECRDLVMTTIDESSIEERGDWAVIKEKIRRALKKYISKRLSKRPFILPVIMEV